MIRDNRAIALLLILGLVVAFFRYDLADFFAAPLREASVTGCGGATLRLSGAEAELLRLHNEARDELGIAPRCASGSSLW